MRFVVFVAVMLFAGVAFGAPRNAAQEAAIDDAVAAVDPALVKTVHAANDAADHGDEVNAALGYAEVHQRAPNVVAITRRLGTAEARAGRTHDGVAHCREALDAEHSAENEAAFAASLLTSRPLLSADATEAVTHASAAAQMAPNADFAQLTLCEAAAAANNLAALDGCSAKLAVLLPKAASTHLYLAMSKGAHDDFDGAQRELDFARAAGYNEKSLSSLEAALTQQRELQRRESFWTDLVIGLATWIGVLFVLLIVGMMVSDSATTGARREISLLYKVILRVAAWSFWPSALISGTLFGFALCVIVARFLVLASAPRWVIAAVGVAALYVIVATIRALFARLPERDLGARVDLDEEFVLRKALEGLSVDEVWIAPGADIEAVRRGSSRALVMGAAGLAGLSRRSLLAIATCELERLSDAATARRASLDALCNRMEERGIASSANPIWWFVTLYRVFYARISAGAARVSEKRAEGSVKAKFGANALVEGRDHLEDRTEEMNERVAAAIATTLEEGEHDAKDTAFYPHDATDEEDAWALFSDRAAIEEEMTKRLRSRLRERAGFVVDQESSASSEARA